MVGPIGHRRFKTGTTIHRTFRLLDETYPWAAGFGGREWLLLSQEFSRGDFPQRR